MLLILIMLGAVVLESTITTMPLFLSFITVYAILHKRSRIFTTAFFGGIILDSLTARVLGSSSLFFIFWIYLILLYDRKYEIKSSVFVFISILSGSIIFLYIFRYNYILLNAILSSFAGLILYLFLKRGMKNRVLL